MCQRYCEGWSRNCDGPDSAGLCDKRLQLSRLTIIRLDSMPFADSVDQDQSNKELHCLIEHDVIDLSVDSVANIVYDIRSFFA